MTILLLEYECVGCSGNNEDERLLTFYFFENLSISIQIKLNRIAFYSKHFQRHRAAAYELIAKIMKINEENSRGE